MINFQEDDYDQLHEYFLPLRAEGKIQADPSGWLDTCAVAADLLPDFQVSSEKLARYQLDDGRALGSTKERIVELISEWEDCALDYDNITLYHSVSEATLATLLFLKRRPLSTIIFETPAYSVTINQARQLGFDTLLCPTYIDNNYTANFSALTLTRRSPLALWLTQPRMSLGYDQSFSDIQNVLATLTANDFLVVDEATEQRFPSQLNYLWRDIETRNIIRIRGFLKGAGLNGLRLAFILHHTNLRAAFGDCQEVLGPSLDAFSLEAAAAIAGRKGKLKEILDAANSQTTSLRLKAEKIVFRSKVRLSELVNGYIGCAMLDLRELSGSYESKRKALLRFCFDQGTPLILGASMRFAFDPKWERVRLNYFSHPSHILKGVTTLLDFTSGCCRQ